MSTLIVFTSFFQFLWFAAKAIPNNDVNARYFVGQFNGDEFPFAIDQCQPTAILSSSYFIYECIDEDTVIQTFYTGTNCANPLYINETYTSQNITGGQYSGELFDFNCDDDAVDAYVSLSLAISDCDSSESNFWKVHAAINVCVQVPDLSRTVNTYCTSSFDGETEDDFYVQLQYFNFGSTCGEEDYMFQRNGTKDCGYMLTSSATDRDVYGRVLACECEDCTNTNAGTSTTSSSDTEPGPVDSDSGFIAQPFWGMVSICLSLASFVVVMKE